MRGLRPGLRALAIAGLALGLAARSAGAAELITVDLLALYTTGAADLYGGDPLPRIHHMIAVTNQIYEDSHVPLRLKLAHAARVNYSDSVDSDTALDDLSSPSALHTAAVALREEHGADMVTLLRPYVGDGLCGIAWIGGYRREGQLSSWDAEHPLSHVTIDCSDSVLAHELGHNMGLVHSRRQDPEGGTFRHSAGHGVDGAFVTVMAYGSAFGASTVYKLSNPALSCAGHPCGVSRNDPDDGADAAHSVGFVAQQLAAYRTAVNPPEPTDPADPTDPGDPTDPIDPVEPSDAEISLAKVKKVRADETLQIQWSSQGIASVDLYIRHAWKQGKQKLESPDWTPIAQGVTGSSFAWMPPAPTLKNLKVQIRAEGRDAGGAVVASHASRWRKVKKARKTKKKGKSSRVGE